jgi:hypothetical protein
MVSVGPCASCAHEDGEEAGVGGTHKVSEEAGVGGDGIVIDYIPVPTGMTETPRTGHQSGTKLAASRTAFYAGRFQSFRTNPAVPDGITPVVNLGTGRKDEIKHGELSTTEKKEDDAR